MDYKKTYEELNTLLPFSPNVKVQQAQREHMTVMGFLTALPSEYEYIKAQILIVTSSSTPPSSQMNSALVGRNMGESKKQ